VTDRLAPTANVRRSDPERWVIIADSSDAGQRPTGGARWPDAILYLARGKKVIFLCAMSMTLGALALAFLLPKQYLATARILPPQNNASASSAMMGQLGDLAILAGRDLGIKNPNLIYIAILRSDSVADALISKHDLKNLYRLRTQSETRRRLLAKTQAELGKEGVITISFSDSNAERAAAIANGFVEQLAGVTSRLAVSEAAQRRLFFEQQLAQARNELADAEVALRQVQESTGVLELEAQAKATIETIARARAELTVREARLQRMRTFATAANPALVRAEREIAALRANVSRLEGRTASDRGAISARGLPSAGVQYVRRLRDVKYHEAVYQFMAKQFEAAKVDEAKQGGLVQVLDRASVPDRRSGPPRLAIVFAGLALGFLFGAVMVLLRAYGLSHLSPEATEKLRLARAALVKH
jgi:tyrosine-protein kinase Etk/Wzc